MSGLSCREPKRAAPPAQDSQVAEFALAESGRTAGIANGIPELGKSTVVGLFCAWVLYRENSARILVMAADYALAKKMVRNVKRIVEQHPLAKHLKPAKLDQWAADQFTKSTVSWNCVTRLCWLKALALISRDCGQT